MSSRVLSPTLSVTVTATSVTKLPELLPVKPTLCHPHTFQLLSPTALQTIPSFSPKTGIFSQEAIHPVCKMRQQTPGKHLFLNPWCALSPSSSWRRTQHRGGGTGRGTNPGKSSSAIPKTIPRITLLPPPQFCTKSRLNPISRLQKSGDFE